MKNIRKEYIEIRKTNYKDFPYEFVKWEKNPHYGKRQQYLDNGYEESFMGEFLQKPGSGSISVSLFKLPETCYVIAWLKKNSEKDFYMETVGDRLLDLNEEELNIFISIYREANKKLKRKRK